MQSTVEEIMTGKISIDKVIQENKEKIQEITAALEEIVRKGYFDILNSTENLVSLFNSEGELPLLTLPENIIIPEKVKQNIEQPIDEKI